MCFAGDVGPTDERCVVLETLDALANLVALNGLQSRTLVLEDLKVAVNVVEDLETAEPDLAATTTRTIRTVAGVAR